MKMSCEDCLHQTIDEVFRGLAQAKKRFQDDGSVYKGFFFQQEFEAYEEALKILAKLSMEEKTQSLN